MALRDLVSKTLLGNITREPGQSREALWDKIADTVVVDGPHGTLAS
jgi:hypothetical protein